MPEVKDWITYGLAVLGIVVTGWFSYLVLKATRATNAVAEATLELNKEITLKEEQRRQEFNQIMRRQLIHQILKESKIVHDALVGIEAMDIYSKLKDAPRKMSIDISELSTYFTYEEVDVISKAWESYEDYITKYYRQTYAGNDMQILVEKAEPVIMAFYNLEQKLKGK